MKQRQGTGRKPADLARECDHILKTKSFRDYPGARNGLQVTHGRQIKKIGWAVDADMGSIRRAGKEKVDFLIVHHGIYWGSSALDRKIRAERIRLAKRSGVAIYSSHLPLDVHPELGNSIGLLRALGLGDSKRKPFGVAMGRAIGWKVEGGRWKRRDLVRRLALLRSSHTERVGSFAGLANQVRDASSVALVLAVRHLIAEGCSLFDLQMVTSHTAKFGAVEVSRAKYLKLLKDAVQ